MPITSTVEMTVEFKIEGIEINIPRQTIILKVRKTISSGATAMSSSVFNVTVQGEDFTAMATHMADGTKNLYDNIGAVAYIYCVANNKLV